MKKLSTFDSLLEEIRDEYQEAKKQASLADTASTLAPAEEIGTVVRQQRKKQGLTLHDLCDLSDVSYTTLTRLEKGNPSVRLDILGRVLNSLGLKLWIG
jgi:DNA-binding XRE family transcriptional regulator